MNVNDRKIVGLQSERGFVTSQEQIFATISSAVISDSFSLSLRKLSDFHNYLSNER